MYSEVKISRQFLSITILCALIFVPLIVDFANGIMESLGIEFSPGRIYRGSIWLLGLFYLIWRQKWTFVQIFILFWLFHVLIWYYLDDKFNFAYDLTFLLKVTYFLVVYEILKTIEMRSKSAYILKFLTLYYKVVTALICLSFITGIGIPTYGQWGFGTKSFFSAQNDIGITILMLFTLALFNRKRLGLNWFWILIGYFSLVLLGTSTGMVISTLVLLFYAIIQFSIGKMGPVKRLAIITALSFIVLGSSVAIYRLISTTPYFSRKYENILDKGIRSDVTVWSQTYFEDRSVAKSVFGEGISSFSKNFAYLAEGAKKAKYKKKGAYVERDFHDIKGAYGWFLLSTLLFFYGMLLLRTFMYFINRKTMFYLSIALVVTLTYLHGYLAGHVFYSPTVAGILAAVIVVGNPLLNETEANEV